VEVQLIKKHPDLDDYYLVRVINSFGTIWVVHREKLNLITEPIKVKTPFKWKN